MHGWCNLRAGPGASPRFGPNRSGEEAVMHSGTGASHCTTGRLPMPCANFPKMRIARIFLNACVAFGRAVCWTLVRPSRLAVHKTASWMLTLHEDEERQTETVRRGR